MVTEQVAVIKRGLMKTISPAGPALAGPGLFFLAGNLYAVLVGLRDQPVEGFELGRGDQVRLPVDIGDYIAGLNRILAGKWRLKNIDK
jgi:hypothetical protein